MPADFLYDVFLSHNHADKPRVRRLCISPAALASGWVALERSTAVHRDSANTDRRFINVRPTNASQELG